MGRTASPGSLEPRDRAVTPLEASLASASTSGRMALLECWANTAAVAAAAVVVGGASPAAAGEERAVRARVTSALPAGGVGGAQHWDRLAGRNARAGRQCVCAWHWWDWGNITRRECGHRRTADADS